MKAPYFFSSIRVSRVLVCLNEGPGRAVIHHLQLLRSVHHSEG